MSTATPPPDRRERLREQTRREAKDIALGQLARTGPSGISVNAIAKAMGMTGPALYRYFANRDELLTALVADAYTDLAGALSHAVAVTPATDKDPAAGLRAFAHAWRGWAREHPDRYLLIYGTPIPGYTAPPATTVIAQRMMQTALEACAGLDPAEATLTAERPPTHSRALRGWTRLHGLVSLEIEGHFNGMDLDVDQLFADEVDALAD
ncbi:TetR/AcrR family transcriptional regulator [Streptomyces sp. NBC_00344]|uniref:TetR/AcrR family transcriptional regulator n=1 Tax=Streptomyces sp. NBC_00344 TaxID=2975720 RepID=UPI002E1D7359